MLDARGTPSRAKLAVVMITLDAELHVRSALESVRWADEILVVDGGSTDRTKAIAAEFGARVRERAFTDFAEQRNHALEQVQADWVLALDADEIVTPELAVEIRAVLATVSAVDAYAIPFKNYLGDIWLRHGGLYPDHHLRLFRRGKARFQGRIHEVLSVDGRCGKLRNPIVHLTYRDLPHLHEKVRRYATLEGNELAQGDTPALLLLLKVPFRFVQVYVAKGGLLDGRRGFLHACALTRYAWILYRTVRSLRRAGGPSDLHG